MVVIVGSILLAFGIDAGWEASQEREEESESLALLHRDVTRTVELARALQERSEARAREAREAVAALAVPSAISDREGLVRTVTTVSGRSTFFLADAAYIDLLNSGRLQVIRDRVLRDEIVSFYQTAVHRRSVMVKNNELALDGTLIPLLYGEGLVLSALERGEWVHRQDPMWELPDSSREWDKLRTSLQLAGLNWDLQETDAIRIASIGEDLAQSIEAYQRSR